MTPRSDLPGRKVRALRQRVALQLGLSAAGGVVAALCGLLITSWAVSGSAAWRRPSFMPLVLWLVVGSIIAYWLWRVVRRSLRWNTLAAAAEIEDRVGLPSGTVQGAVEPGLERPGVSRPLLELHRTRVAERLEGRRVGQLGSGLARSARRTVAVTLGLATLALAASTAIWVQARESAADAWAAVLDPVTHLTLPPLPRLRLVAESEDVRRGRDLPVSIHAPQRDSVQLIWQPSGQVPSRRWYEVSNGPVSAVVPRLDAPTRVWVRAPDGAVSDTLNVTPIDPLLLLDMRLTLSYPAHTGRERELFSAPLPALTVPEGTRATVMGFATRPLRRAALRNALGLSIAFDITEDRRFNGSFRVRSGAWGWDIVGSQGAALESEIDSLVFTVVPDSVPLVDVVYPGVDTVMNTDMVQPLIVEAIDDYGLSRVELVSWRISVWGERWPEDVMPIELQDDGSRAWPGGEGHLPEAA